MNLPVSGIGRSVAEAIVIDAAPVTIYTPGSTNGVPLDLIGSLRAPGPDVEPEATTDEIEGFVTGLLAMAGLETDPLTSPEHILLTNLIADQWAKGRDLDLATLLGLVQDPGPDRVPGDGAEIGRPLIRQARCACLRPTCSTSTRDAWAALERRRICGSRPIQPRASI